jgi:hypothetical protein
LAGSQSPTRARACGNVWSRVQRKDELLLSEHFSEGVRWARKGAPDVGHLRVLNFDWHGMIKDLKDKGTVEGLWALLQNILPQVPKCPSLLSGDPSE